MKIIVQSILKKLGYEIKKIIYKPNSAELLKDIFDDLKVNVIFDIGANIGQFAQEVRSNGYKDTIVSFEPLSDARKVLMNKTENDAKWIVHDQCAVGNYDGTIEINISQNSFSSSVLPISESHTSVASDSKYIGIEKVPIIQLDSVMDLYLSQDSNLFVKIDTQGFESQVLDGGEECLKNAVGVFCELSIVPLYEGQTLWLEMIEKFNHLGFELKSVHAGFKNPNTNQLLQVDGLFIKKDE